MEQTYCEWLVKRRKTVMNVIIKVLAIAAVIALLFTTLLSIWLSVLGFGAAGFLIWYWPRFDVSIEYIYCDGQLDFDQIFGEEKRKNALRIEIENADVIAPRDSSRLAGYQQLPVKDFTSREPDARVYGIATKEPESENKVLILFEPSDKMLDMMAAKCPRIVEK